MSKLSKKDLRSGNEAVWQASNSALSWLKSQWLIFTIILLLGAGLLIGGAVYVHFTRKKEAEAQHVLAKALGEFQQWKLADEKAKEDALKKLNERLTELTSKHNHSKASQYAGLIQAQIQIESKNWSEALKHLGDFEKALPRRRKSMAWYPMAVAHEELSQNDKAAEFYKLVIDSKDPSYRKWAMLGQARSLKALNRTEEAKTIYTKFLEEFAKSPEVPMVRGLLTQVSTMQPSSKP